METKNPKRIELASYSAGTVILRLTPGEETVALVFNILSQELQRVPTTLLNRQEFRDRVIEMQGDHAIVSFDQRAGLGTPFGKEEPGDEKNRRVTAERETLEETGSLIGDRIIEQISYTEQPNSWSTYSNTVFLANGIGFHFNRPFMCDPNVNARYSGFYPLGRLPYYYYGSGKAHAHHMPIMNVGIYNAALRRLVATLLQLDRPLLRALGRPDADSAEDIVWVVIKDIPYHAFFSHKMFRTVVGLKREDLFLTRLARSRGKITRAETARMVGGHLVHWLSGNQLDEGLKILLKCADPRILSGPKGLEHFLAEKLLKKEQESESRRTLERMIEEEEEHGFESEPIAADSEEPSEGNLEDYERLWLSLNPDIEKLPESTKTKPEGGIGDMPLSIGTPAFYACIGKGRSCGKAALAGELTCIEHKGELNIALPAKVLIRMHFSAQSGFGKVIIEELMREGVPFVERTKTRQEELELARMMTSGVRVFGNEDLGPNVVVADAVGEMKHTGYVLTNVHVLSLDEVVQERSPDKVGARTVVFLYEYGGTALSLTETAAMLLSEPFMSARVWVNLVDAAGTQIHAVELTAYQHGHPAHHELRFAKSVWAFKKIPRPEKPRKHKA